MIAAAPVIRFQEIDSTNAEALRRAAAGERGPVWLVAETQTLGRGRSGRSWSSPRGNLAATLLFEPNCDPAALPQLALVAGVATAEAFQRIDGSRAKLTGLQLKWPNDILIGMAKVAGVLVESSVYRGSILSAVGIGANVKSAPTMPDGRAVTSLAECGLDSGAETLFASLAEAMDRALTDWAVSAGFASIRARWLSLAPAIGAGLMINTGAQSVHGTFAGLGEDGSLLMTGQDGAALRFSYGDVTADYQPPEREFDERGAVTGGGTD